jgi:O-succinylbenzoic acid--CoA ligase
MKIKINHKEYSSKYFLQPENEKEFENENPIGKQVFGFLNSWFSNSKFLEIKTSGSTGKPKVFSVEKWKLEASAKRTLDFFDLNKESTFLLCLPISFIAGKLMVIRSMLNNGNLITQTPSSSPLTSLKIPVDFGAITPMQMLGSIESVGIENIAQIKFLLIGGASVSDSLITQLEGFKGNVFETFGMTETLTHFALRECYPIKQKAFKLLPEISMQAIDGKLTVKSNSFLQEVISTNDIVEITNNNQFIWKGRADFTINSGGIKVQPESIESKLLETTIPTPFYISFKPDEKLGQKMVLCVLQGNSKIIKDANFRNLEKIEKPKAIVEVDEFPLAENGKILRNQLAKKIENLLEWSIG